jgi:hypothetical protein
MRAVTSLDDLAELADQNVASVTVDEAPAGTRIRLQALEDGAGTEIDVELPLAVPEFGRTLALRIRIAGVERTARVAHALGHPVVFAALVRLRGAAARRLRRLMRRRGD